MRNKVNELVSVLLLYDRRTGKVMPQSVTWNSRVYHITQLGLHYQTKQGRTLCHVFAVVADSLALKLRLETDHLTWTCRLTLTGR